MRAANRQIYSNRVDEGCEEGKREGDRGEEGRGDEEVVLLTVVELLLSLLLLSDSKDVP